MPLIKELKIENVVILANSFNPSIFSTHWLIKNGICDEASIQPNYVFAPNISQVSTTEWQLLVLPNQLQFAKAIDFKGNVSGLVDSKLLPIIKLLKEIPYATAGINFHWFVKDSKQTIAQLSKSLFNNKESKFNAFFSSDDTRMGAYFSKDIENARLKLDIKPIMVVMNMEGLQEEVIQFAFNYHKDLDLKNPQEDLLKFLSKYKEFFDGSNKLMEQYA